MKSIVTVSRFGRSKAVTIASGSFWIGTGSDCECQLPTSWGLEPKHLRVEYENGFFNVQVGSRSANAMVGDAKAELGKWIFVPHNAAIKIGETSIRLEVVKGDMPPKVEDKPAAAPGASHKGQKPVSKFAGHFRNRTGPLLISLGIALQWLPWSSDARLAGAAYVVVFGSMSAALALILPAKIGNLLYGLLAMTPFFWGTNLIHLFVVGVGAWSLARLAGLRVGGVLFVGAAVFGALGLGLMYDSMSSLGVLSPLNASERGYAEVGQKLRERYEATGSYAPQPKAIEFEVHDFGHFRASTVSRGDAEVFGDARKGTITMGRKSQGSQVFEWLPYRLPPSQMTLETIGNLITVAYGSLGEVSVHSRRMEETEEAKFFHYDITVKSSDSALPMDISVAVSRCADTMVIMGSTDAVAHKQTVGSFQCVDNPPTTPPSRTQHAFVPPDNDWVKARDNNAGNQTWVRRDRSAEVGLSSLSLAAFEQVRAQKNCDAFATAYASQNGFLVGSIEADRSTDNGCSVWLNGIEVESGLAAQAYFAISPCGSVYANLVFHSDYDLQRDLGPKISRCLLKTDPEGCDIKGNISDNGRIYHVPGNRWYDRTTIDESAGERWFCTESEAEAAGWLAPRQ